MTAYTDSTLYNMIETIPYANTHTHSVRMQDLESAAVQSSSFKARVCTVCECGCVNARAFVK